MTLIELHILVVIELQNYVTYLFFIIPFTKKNDEIMCADWKARIRKDEFLQLN